MSRDMTAIIEAIYDVLDPANLTNREVLAVCTELLFNSAREDTDPTARLEEGLVMLRLNVTDALENLP